MQIDWWTLALQGINFLVLVWLLRRFLYHPVREVIAKRKQLAEQAFAEAAAEKQEAEDAKRRFDEEKRKLADEREELLARLRADMGAERDAVLDEARQKAEQLLEDGRQSLDRERKSVLEDMRGEVISLAGELAAGLLRNVGTSVPSAAFLARIEQDLKALAPDERERLQSDLAAEDTPIAVITAVPLTPDEEKDWSERLSEILGRSIAFSYAVDPDVLGGAELRFPHVRIKFTWADQLQRARELVQDETDAS